MEDRDIEEGDVEFIKSDRNMFLLNEIIERMKIFKEKNENEQGDNKKDGSGLSMDETSPVGK